MIIADIIGLGAALLLVATIGLIQKNRDLQASQTTLTDGLDEAYRAVAELQDKLEQLEAALDQQESYETQEAEGQLELELFSEEDAQ